jgi:hypothetical protein
MKPKTPKVLIAAVLIGAVLLCLRHARAEEDVYACYGSSRYEAMYDAWPACNERTICDKVRFYLKGHSEAEARAKAVEMHLPKWMIHKAERCIHDGASQ